MRSIPARFAGFGLLCAAWAAAMAFSGRPLVYAAGEAWFLNWSVQIGVTLLRWTYPFSLPARYYRPWRRRGPGSASGLPFYGMSFFERVVKRINPLPFDRRSFATLDAAMRAAETTHAITFATGWLLAAALAAAGSVATASFLALWNVTFNAYAIALQRQNRARVQRLARRRGEASAPRGGRPAAPRRSSAAASSSP